METLSTNKLSGDVSVKGKIPEDSRGKILEDSKQMESWQNKQAMAAEVSAKQSSKD